MLFTLPPSINYTYGTNKSNTDRNKTLTDHVLTNSPEKSHLKWYFIALGLFDHELIYSSRKAPFLKLNEHYEISFRSMKNYSDKIFVDQ